ncbi:MAG: polysaccharide pyruvyl transferase CsaB [Candidatus Cryosericum sp.]
MTRVVVLGYYGFGNFGDELILRAMQDELQALDCQAAFVVNNPDQYKDHQTPRFSFVDRHNVAAVMRAVRGCDVVVLGGGGLVQDVTSVRSNVYYLGIPLLALALGKRVAAYALGVGPLTRASSRHLVRMVFGHMTLIDVRDQASADLLYSCGVDRAKIAVSSDAGLSLLLSENVVAHAATAQGPFILAAIHPHFGWTAEETASFLDCLASQYGAQVRLVVLFPASDAGYTGDVHDRLLTPSTIVTLSTTQELIGLCASAIFTIAGRYHMVAAGVAAESPVVALAYDAKVSQLAAFCGLECILRGTSPQEAASTILGKPLRRARPGVAQEALAMRADRIARLKSALELHRR